MDRKLLEKFFCKHCSGQATHFNIMLLVHQRRAQHIIWKGSLCITWHVSVFIRKFVLSIRSRLWRNQPSVLEFFPVWLVSNGIYSFVIFYSRSISARFALSISFTLSQANFKYFSENYPQIVYIVFAILNITQHFSGQQCAGADRERHSMTQKRQLSVQNNLWHFIK